MKRSTLAYIMWAFWLVLAWQFHEMAFTIISMVWMATAVVLGGIEAKR